MNGKGGQRFVGTLVALTALGLVVVATASATVEGPDWLGTDSLGTGPRYVCDLIHVAADLQSIAATFMP